MGGAAAPPAGKWIIGTGLYHQQYSYTGVKADGATNGSVDGTISAITTTVPGQSVITSTYGYNDLRQLTSKGVTVPDQNGKQTKVYDRSYTYDRIAVDSGNWMGTRLASTSYTFGSSSRSFTYTYDAAGNISRIVTAGTSVPKAAQLKEYTYDAQGQLVSEKNSSKTTFLYAYDTAGNIRSVTKDGTVTKSFGYTNPSWPDLLTSVTANGTTKDVLYEGQSQTSDLPSSGNPITYYNGKDYTFTWTKGRQLASATVDGKQVSYTYDMSGVRTSKTVNGTTYNYTTLSGKVMRQTWGNKSLEFVYDDGNQPFAMIYNDGSTSTLYYYVLNAQGDVIALLNANGTLAASYNYGAWGNYSVHGADGKKTTDATFIGHINPLRYRGYYYDRETRLYYLQSRYYDFANCRFINADAYATTNAESFLSCNMFAYCENNPINRVDPDGVFWRELGAKISKTWGKIKSWASNTFGAGATLVQQTKHSETELVSWGLNYFVTAKSGTSSSITLASKGNSSKPFSVYAQGRSDNYMLSSAGFKFNASGYTGKLSIGMNDIGISVSHKDEYQVNSYAIKVDLSQLKVVFEVATTVENGVYTDTYYHNCGITGIGLLAAAMFFETGNVLQMN